MMSAVMSEMTTIIPNGETALILENDPMIRSEIDELLTECNFRTRCCDDFIGAMEEMEFDEEVSVVIADFHLMGDRKHSFNGMNFIDCCRMRYPNREIRYFLMSGDREALVRNECDREVVMVPKHTVVEQLTAHLAPDEY